MNLIKLVLLIPLCLTANAMLNVKNAAAQILLKAPPENAVEPSSISDLKGALAQTGVVVDGLVSDILYEYSEDKGPWTRVVLTDAKALFGSSPPTVEILHFGGPLPNGRQMVAAELPVFVKGKRYVVFLRNTAWNVSPVVGDLAFRVEKLDSGEVLVNTDGQAVTGLGSRGVEFGPAVFEGPRLDGLAPQVLSNRSQTEDSKFLNRQSFVKAMAKSLSVNKAVIEGDSYSYPKGEFKWRMQSTGAQGAKQSVSPTANVNKSALSNPEIDTSRPTNEGAAK